MSPVPRRRMWIFTVVSLLCVATEHAAAQRFEWPEKPENLRVLPSDFTGRQLSAVMRGFASALGVRCSHCHVGEEGQPLDTFDFASDENPKKNVARTMLRLLGVVNDSLDTFDPSGPERVNMWCHTCHRGRPRPMKLDEELLETYTHEGAEAALAHYHDLRERFYGRGSYDFGEAALNELGYALLRDGVHDAALEAFELNVTYFPESFNVYDSLAEAHLTRGDSTSAIQNYERSLELQPQNQNARRMLEELRSP